jgi:hypothetical protein
LPPAESQESAKERLAHAQVAVQGKGGLAAEGNRSGPAALAEHDDHLVVQVEVAGEHDPGRLRDPYAGVEEQPQDGRVPPVGEVAALAGFGSRRSSSSVRTGGGLSGICGGFMPAIGLASSSPSATAHLKNAWRPR